MRPNTYAILTRAIEEGVAYGYTRAYKHTDAPSEEELKDAMYQAVVNAICEVFTFEDPYAGED